MADRVITFTISEELEADALKVLDFYANKDIKLGAGYGAIQSMPEIIYNFEGKQDGEGQIAFFKRFIRKLFLNAAQLAENTETNIERREAINNLNYVPKVIDDGILI